MKKNMIINLVLSIFLTCLYAILMFELLIEEVLYDGVHFGDFGEVLGNYVFPLACIITMVGIIGMFIISIVRRIKKIISWKEFFIECVYIVAGIGVGTALSALYLVIRIMNLRDPFYL